MANRVIKATGRQGVDPARSTLNLYYSTLLLLLPMVSRRTGVIAGLVAAVVTILVVGVGFVSAAAGMFRLTLQASATRIPEGGTVTFTGRFTVNNEPLAGVIVDLLAQRPELGPEFQSLGSPQTDQFGNFEFTMTFPEATTFIVKARAPLPAE